MRYIKYWFWDLWYKYKEWRFERKCIKHLDMKPTKEYVTKEQYDALVEIINRPPDPEAQERFRKVLERKVPWDDE